MSSKSSEIILLLLIYIRIYNPNSTKDVFTYFSGITSVGKKHLLTKRGFCKIRIYKVEIEQKNTFYKRRINALFFSLPVKILDLEILKVFYFYHECGSFLVVFCLSKGTCIFLYAKNEDEESY